MATFCAKLRRGRLVRAGRRPGIGQLQPASPPADVLSGMPRCPGRKAQIAGMVAGLVREKAGFRLVYVGGGDARSPFLVGLVALGLVLCGLGGCVPLIPEDGFVELTSRFALAPQRTCGELKRFAGVASLPDVDNPGELGLTYEEAFVPVAEGLRVRLWYLPAAAERGTVVFSMGAAAGMNCYLLIPKELVAAGWSVVIYEYEGFGESDGRASMAVLLRDADAVLDWTLERTARARVTLLGASVGTIPSVALAAERPGDVNAVVLDGAISLRAEIDRLWFLYGGQTERYLAHFDRRMWLEEQITRVHQPVLAFAYGRDEYATSARMPEILAGCPGPTTLHTFPELGHARGPYRQTGEYFDILEGFLSDVWGTESPAQ